MNPNNQAENRVVGICGSLRRNSYTRMAVQIALQGAQEAGAQTQLIDLQDYHLIFCNGNEDESIFPEDVFRLRREVNQAGGIILGTPVYHGSFSGVLKNALDLMSFDHHEIEGKIIGLVGVSGSAQGADYALNSLRILGQGLHNWVIPEQVSIPETRKVFDQLGTLKDSDLEKRLKEVGSQVARFAYLHTSEKEPEFLRVWEGDLKTPS